MVMVTGGMQNLGQAGHTLHYTSTQTDRRIAAPPTLGRGDTSAGMSRVCVFPIRNTTMTPHDATGRKRRRWSVQQFKAIEEKMSEVRGGSVALC